MIRLFLILPMATLLTPAYAQEAGSLQDRARKTTAKAINEQIGNPGRAEISPMVQSGGSLLFCANTDAYNANGYFIGLSYWEVTLNADGSEVTQLRDVTGLNSVCYNADYEPYSELTDQ